MVSTNATKICNPMDGIFELLRWLDGSPPKFMNYNMRGDMITLYFPIDEMLSYSNLLFSNGYADDINHNIWIHRGYPKSGNYFRVGPYAIRIAQYREKMYNQQDVKWLQEQYQDQVSDLKRQLLLANKTIESIQQLIIK